MASIKIPLDYLSAVRTATRRQSCSYYNAFQSVLVSRLQHGVGPWWHSLFNLAGIPRDHWNDYLVDERLRVVLRAINQPAAREIVNDKLAFHDHCVAHSLKTIPIVCALQREDIDQLESSVSVRTEKEWCNRLHSAPDRLFVKLIDGTWGMEAFVAQKKGSEWYYSNQSGSASMFYSFLRQRMNSQRGWIVQPLVEAHQELKPITSSQALPTIRVNTCIIDGMPRLLFAALRIPVGDNITDNFGHGSSGNIIAPVDLETGRLGTCRGSTSLSWPNVVDFPVHPDTGDTIEGRYIPMWGEVLELLQQGQKSLPNLCTLGWDVTVTDDGPLIVETNPTYDVDLIQVAHQRGVRPQLEEVISDWCGKSEKSEKWFSELGRR